MRLIIVFGLMGVCFTSIYGQKLFPNPLANLEKTLLGNVNKAIGRFDKKMGNLVDDIKNTTRTLDEMAHCYEAELAGYVFNIFNHTLNFKDLTAQYYKIFPDKTINIKSIENLFNSTKELITRCLDPKYRSTAKYGYTELSDLSEKDVEHMCGAKAPTEVAATPLKLLDNCKVSPTLTLPKSFDWRAQNILTSVKNQGACGSCWAFSTAGAIESALVRAKKASLTIDLSEQQLVNCAKAKGCEGGSSYIAFTYTNKTGIATEAAKKYTGKEASCGSPLAAAERIRGFCLHSKFRYTSAGVAENITDDTMARALVQFGPLYMTVDANPFNYKNYRTGILDSPTCTTKINHAVMLVGYNGTDNSWIIKNSWGDKWGDKGYFKVVRGKNMCGVNTEIAWPVL